MIRRMAGLVVLALAIIIVVFYGLLQFLLRHGSNYSVTFSAAATALTALLTAAAVVAAVVYVSLTYGLWQETAAQVRNQKQMAETALMQSLMVEYDQLRNSIQVIQQWWRERAGSNPRDAFRFSLAAKDPDIVALDDHRFRVSRFFVRIRKLAAKGFVSEDLIEASLSRESIQMFLDQVDSLDHVKRQIAGREPNLTDTHYFRSLLQRRYQNQ